MPNKPQDTDFLYISARLKALEKNMLTREKLLRLVSSRSDEDALKLLVENGYAAFDLRDMQALEAEISRRRKEVFDLIGSYVPDKRIIDLFRLKYDYHNIKSLIKAAALGEDGSHLLSDAGMVPPKTLTAMLQEKQFRSLNPIMQKACEEAFDLLSRTADPQQSDLLLDNAMCAQMLSMAQQAQSEFLLGYVKLFIDLNNLRVLVRASLGGKGYDFLQRAVCAGGSIGCSQLREVTSESITALFGHGIYLSAASAAVSALSHEGLSALDMACDNALIEYIRSSRLIPFGEAPVISYLLAFEAQLVSLRTVLSGKRAGLSQEQIQERLRLSYV